MKPVTLIKPPAYRDLREPRQPVDYVYDEPVVDPLSNWDRAVIVGAMVAGALLSGAALFAIAKLAGFSL